MFPIGFLCETEEWNERKKDIKRIFLSTKGRNEADVPISMVKFLKYVGAELTESEQDFEDEFIEQLQKFVQHVKKSREMEERYMLFEELLRDERAEGKAEGKAETVIDFLEELGTIPADLHERILNETNLETLSKWVKLAAKADSIDQFLKEI